MRFGKFLFLAVVFLLILGFFSEAGAQSYGAGMYPGRGFYPRAPVNPYYANPYGYGDVVIIQQRVPILIERRGSNDALYTFDNVYGPEASAAGRMSHTVLNPQPQFFQIY